MHDDDYHNYIKNLKQFLLGYTISSVASSVAEISTYPLDTVKTRMQMQAKHISPHSYGMLSVTQQIIREEGVRGLFSGAMPACIRHVVYSGSRVVLYEKLRGEKKGDMHVVPAWRGIFAGLVSGGLAQILASPTDLLKVQMQLDRTRKHPRFKGLSHAMHVIHAEGNHSFWSWWRGWQPNSLRAAFVQLGDLTTYDQVKGRIKSHFHLNEGALLHGLSAGCCGLVAATLGAPFDLIKTRFMNQPVGVNALYKSSTDCFLQTVRQEGLLALWQGWLPTWLRMAPWSLMFFLTYEEFRKLAGLKEF